VCVCDGEEVGEVKLLGTTHFSETHSQAAEFVVLQQK